MVLEYSVGTNVLILMVPSLKDIFAVPVISRLQCLDWMAHSLCAGSERNSMNGCSRLPPTDMTYTSMSLTSLSSLRVDKCIVNCNWMSAVSVSGGAIWWTPTKERQARCNLQVKLHVWSMSECFETIRIVKWRYIYIYILFLSFTLRPAKPNVRQSLLAWSMSSLAFSALP